MPVVAYDLPPLREPYPKGMLRVPPRDMEAFAKTVIALLTRPALYDATKRDAMNIVQDWDWDNRAADSLHWLRQAMETDD